MKRLYRKSIAHYDKMIEWAEKQKPKKTTNRKEMESEIDESWFAFDCDFCNKYNNGGFCSTECPLTKNGCYSGCCNGLWQKMNSSKTWGTFVKRAKKVREYIIEHGCK